MTKFDIFVTIKILKRRNFMKEFFGIGGYERPAEGFLSWQHLLFVSILMAVMIGLAVFFRLKKS